MKRNRVFAVAAEEETSEEEVLFMSNFKTGLKRLAMSEEAEDVILYTNKRREITSLGSETLGSALLDSGCSMNVTGKGWWNSYRARLPETMRR